MKNEILTATAIGHTGNVLATISSMGNVRHLMARIDSAHPNCQSAKVVGEFTSDGTNQGVGKGRVLASREPRTIDGVFYSGWMID